ncbi:DNA-processing protein DprA [Catenuloplanes japonicus]|uniref:DNA-processing protein DprA n=1 Tax=Catenuloplanes japonicus TaxID=33876 RepID=UPI00068DCF95|nr:DNA-processing protein DprA [Catenuloplanes japonicus]
MNELRPAVAVTGHRGLGHARDWVSAELTLLCRRLRDQHGTTTGLSGMAQGADTLWAEAVLAAGLDLWAVIPYEAQADRWPDADRARWQRLRDSATRTLVAAGPPATRGESAEAMFRRNDMLVDHSSALVCVWDGRRSGGTWRTVRYAADLGRPIIRLHPVTRSVTDLGLDDPALASPSGDAPRRSP